MVGRFLYGFGWRVTSRFDKCLGFWGLGSPNIVVIGALTTVISGL